MSDVTATTAHPADRRTESGDPGVLRLVVVDDHALVREGTVELLEREEDLTVVGQAGSGEEGLEVVTQALPDVALVDVGLPRMNGVALARALADSAPSVRVIILSAYDDYALEALDAGVAGYLLKRGSARGLVDAIRTVAAGSLVLDEAVSRRLTDSWSRSGEDLLSELTRRETDVLRLVARGLANKQIARQLGLGLRTVESHVSSIIAKLGVTSRTEAALYAVASRGAPSGEPGRTVPPW